MSWAFFGPMPGSRVNDELVAVLGLILSDNIKG